MIHLIGQSPENNSLIYSDWQNGQWSEIDLYRLPSNLDFQGLSAFSRPEGVFLTSAWLSKTFEEQTWQTHLYYTNRSIAKMEANLEVTLQPTTTPTLIPTVSEIPTVALTPTPDLNQIPEPSTPLLPPLVLGGGLAILIVSGLLAGRLLYSRRKQ